jgi:ubiquinone/menaquinone biosynthesis C-methylase UbiE
METPKLEVKNFWEQASCGEELYLKGDNEKHAFINQSVERYTLEPEILKFAEFSKAANKTVLEIGVGLGADHQQFAEAGAQLYGIDLTERAIVNTKRRFEIFGLHSDLQNGDAENLAFNDNFFDIVYSWGVIHHSPNTKKIVQQIHRVLKPGGQAKIMIYHKKSIVGYMLWLRYGLLRLKPFISLEKVYHQYLESPGTKAYTVEEARVMFSSFSDVNIETTLTHADLLNSEAGQRHRGLLLKIAKRLFPRLVIKKLLPQHGLFMLITATK